MATLQMCDAWFSNVTVPEDQSAWEVVNDWPDSAGASYLRYRLEGDYARFTYFSTPTAWPSCNEGLGKWDTITLYMNVRSETSNPGYIDVKLFNFATGDLQTIASFTIGSDIETVSVAFRIGDVFPDWSPDDANGKIDIQVYAAHGADESAWHLISAIAQVEVYDPYLDAATSRIFVTPSNADLIYTPPPEDSEIIADTLHVSVSAKDADLIYQEPPPPETDYLDAQTEVIDVDALNAALFYIPPPGEDIIVAFTEKVLVWNPVADIANSGFEAPTSTITVIAGKAYWYDPSCDDRFDFVPLDSAITMEVSDESGMLELAMVDGLISLVASLESRIDAEVYDI